MQKEQAKQKAESNSQGVPTAQGLQAVRSERIPRPEASREASEQVSERPATHKGRPSDRPAPEALAIREPLSGKRLLEDRAKEVKRIIATGEEYSKRYGGSLGAFMQIAPRICDETLEQLSKSEQEAYELERMGNLYSKAQEAGADLRIPTIEGKPIQVSQATATALEILVNIDRLHDVIKSHCIAMYGVSRGGDVINTPFHNTYIELINKAVGALSDSIQVNREERHNCIII